MVLVEFVIAFQVYHHEELVLSVRIINMLQFSKNKYNAPLIGLYESGLE